MDTPETTWHDLDVKNLADKFYQRQQARRAAERKAEAWDRWMAAESTADLFPGDPNEQEYARRMYEQWQALQ
jgi:hypothetical protein